METEIMKCTEFSCPHNDGANGCEKKSIAITEGGYCYWFYKEVIEPFEKDLEQKEREKEEMAWKRQGKVNG